MRILPIFAILVFAGGLLFFGCLEPQQPVVNDTDTGNNTTVITPPLVGNDSDEHGCKGSAGYKWCDISQKCIRPWEENCTLVMNITNFDDCAAAGYPVVESYPEQCIMPNQTFTKDIDQTYLMNQTICEDGGGHWITCSSICEETEDGTVCSEYRCMSYCECGGLGGFRCPENFYCTDYYPEWTSDALGVCRPNSELIDDVEK
ncbi:MAG: hypothetical protein ABID61_00140 [Candidatus Micrarchaeota archaeon]